MAQDMSDAEVRGRLSHRIERDIDIMLQSLTAVCQRLIDLKYDTATMVQSPTTSNSSVYAINSNTPSVGKSPIEKRADPRVYGLAMSSISVIIAG
ncbi:hypothetical protein T265_11809 [Opisthorchis viverrini]|uniref:Uncharacterized protein n=1 Tax=Opisthorchis viverrini TaxID=6198 RepID=A0A074YXM5_OPIVI|nr:hypothetical protein T265_11809 [Opisthorchis viverrini]KER19418.1 hypothetical protein T265_11809 [Opisthorchis viverrini]